MKTKLKKTALLFALVVGFGTTLYAQSESDALFDRYSGQEGYTSVHITKYMFQLFADIETESEMEEFREMAAQIDRIKILTAEDDSTSNSRAAKFYREINKSIPLDKYEELMVVNDGDEQVHMYIIKNGKNISEFLMLVSEPESSVMISITGDIDLDKLAALSKTMNIDGLQGLDTLKTK
jgi:hypothetical protein